MSRSSHKVIKKITAFLLVFTIALSPMVPIAAEAAISNKWLNDAKIRPGIMSGSERTDFFIDYFIPFGPSTDSLFYFDINGRIDDEDSNEQNIGLGFRTLGGGERYILGANIYYDTILSEFDNRFNQFGFGLEALTNRFDARFNYYMPQGETLKKGEATEYKFAPSALLVDNGYEEALEGFDFELGVLVPYVSDYAETRFYAGLYDYSTDQINGDDVDGTRFRLEVRPVDALSINIEHYAESGGDSNTVAGFYFDIPFAIEELFEAGGNPFKAAYSSFKLGKGTRTLRDRLTEKVIRDRHIIIAEDEAETYKNMIYVNGENTGGTGTQSDPYELLNTAMGAATENTIIYITSSDAVAETYTTNVTLLDGQELWSDGVVHPIYNLGGTGPAAIIDGGGNIVTLADNNSIVGLALINGNYGIYGSGTYDVVPASDTSIHSTFIAGNNIQNMAAGGIYISNSYSGSDDLNNLSYDFDIRGNNLSSSGASGIYIENLFDTTGTANNVSFNNYIATNVLNGNGDNGVEIFNALLAEESALNIVVNNSFDSNWMNSNTNDGAYIDNYITASSNYTTSLNPTSATLTGYITNSFTGNTIDGNTGNGVNINRNILNSEALSTSAAYSSNLTSSTNGTITNYFDGNTVSNNSDHGVLVNQSLITSFATAVDSTVTGDVTATTSGLITSTFTNNIVDSNDGFGITLSNNEVFTRALGKQNTAVNGNIAASSAGSSINTTFDINTVTGNGFGGNLSGIYIDNDIYSEGAADDNTAVTGNVTGSSSNSSTIISLTSNTIDGNSNHGVEIFDNSIDALTSLGFTGGATTVGGSIIATNDYSTAKIISTGNSYSSNGTDGFNLTGQYIYSDSWAYEDSATTGNISASSSNSTASVSFTGDTFSGNTNGGVYLGENAVESFAGGDNATSLVTIGGDVVASAENSSAKISATNSDFSGNTGSDGFYSLYNGIYAETRVDGLYNISGNLESSTNSSRASNTFTNNTVSSNIGDGINLNETEVQAFTYTDISGTVSGNIESSALSSSIANNVSSNTTNSNTGAGIDINSSIETSNSVISGTVTGTQTTDVTNSAITATTDNNISLTNGGDGLNISTTTATATTGQTTVTVSGTGNEIYGNGYGIVLNHSGPSASYSASFNLNTIANNATYDFDNGTNTTVDALNNWWGSATPNFGSILTGDPIDYDPWTGK